ncbi:MAG: hypothetical protein U0105_15010 [Candidatus Obscuribacterales bacterium]
MLASLPDRDFTSGIGEIIKYALIEKTVAAESEYAAGPRSMFQLLQQMAPELSFEHPAMGNIIAASIKMKLAVVARDPYEKRLRRILNLGHTFGHAIEKVSKYSWTHGEAVAVGLLFAMQVSRRLGKVDDAQIEVVRTLLSQCKLPVTLSADLDRNALFDAMAYDKKRAGQSIRFVLPLKELGSADVDSEISLDELRHCVEDFQ